MAGPAVTTQNVGVNALGAGPAVARDGGGNLIRDFSIYRDNDISIYRQRWEQWELMGGMGRGEREE